MAEIPFRIALLAILVLTMSVVVYHRVSADSGERFDRRQEGTALAVVLRLAGFALWLFTLAYLIRPAWMHWAALPLVDGVRWLGAAVGVLCAGLMVWTLSSLGKNLTDTVATREQATLVTDGPYRFVRHPFYVVAGLLMLSVTLLTASAAIGVAGLVVATLLVLRTPNEERRLLETFGEPYEAYRRRTGAFLPKLHGGP
jgi:protein-S-isoprenylcysteine O-methyltransferase Ste14